MFLSMLRNICPLETCPLGRESGPVGRTHDRTCLLKLVREALDDRLIKELPLLAISGLKK